LATNEALADSPDLVNKAPHGEGWMIKVRPSDTGELESLMDAGAYDEYVKGLH
ncbi:MAG TPA: glycine cleavage system protein H, partial [Chloroflexota bacterium]|nr:glycine cleavage system protein H [Chloroflexota bacterium]